MIKSKPRLKSFCDKKDCLVSFAEKYALVWFQRLSNVSFFKLDFLISFFSRWESRSYHWKCIQCSWKRRISQESGHFDPWISSRVLQNYKTWTKKSYFDNFKLARNLLRRWFPWTESTARYYFDNNSIWHSFWPFSCGQKLWSKWRLPRAHHYRFVIRNWRDISRMLNFWRGWRENSRDWWISRPMVSRFPKVLLL